MPPVKKMGTTEQTTPGVVKDTPIGEFPSITEFTKKGFSEIVQATSAVNAIPHGAARDLYCAHPVFGRIIDKLSERILGLMSKVIKRENVKGNIQIRQEDEKFELLLESNDSLLERINTNLDEWSGVKKTSEVNVDKRIMQPGKSASAKNIGSWNKRKELNSMEFSQLNSQYKSRPQLNFPIPVDNSNIRPFEPKLKEKPNSLKPLAILPEYDDTGNIVSYLHPYEFELMKFEVSEAFLCERNPQVPLDTKTTELVYVDTVEKLKNVVEDLKGYTELAVDVEHHSYRSFLGFTCLVQISTRDKDYIFDALNLREEMHILNIIFTDPKVVKIFHGADSDVEWLQRDLSLYLVNMFDTHQAAIALNFARHSLAYILKHYCNIDADKTYQLADWRIRPLPQVLLEYARQDTHHLIYVYERMVNDLLKTSNAQSNLLRITYQRSTELCKKRYVKPILNPETLYHHSKRIFDNRQMYAYREIYNWRDTVARNEDESIGYVLPNHMVLQIAETLPREMQGILACCNPVPPLVRQNLHKLHQIILRAREQPLVKPVTDGIPVRRIVANKFDKYNSQLHCPHDFPQKGEDKVILPTLLKFKVMSLGNGVQQETYELAPQYYRELYDEDFTKPFKKSGIVINKNIVRREETTKDSNLTKRDEMLKNMQFQSPYQRYLAMLPTIEKERREEKARLAEDLKNHQLCPSNMVVTTKKEIIKEEKTDSADDEHISIKEMLRQAHKKSITGRNRQSDEDNPPKRFKFSPNEPNNSNKQIKQNENIKIIKSEGANSKQNAQMEIPSDSEGPPEERPSSSTRQGNIPNNKKNKKGKKNKVSKSFQSSNKAIPAAFDYGTVNFKKFKGGAQRAKQIEIKGQFQGKGKISKTQNKKFNKLFTFSNAKMNKKK